MAAENLITQFVSFVLSVLVCASALTHTDAIPNRKARKEIEGFEAYAAEAEGFDPEALTRMREIISAEEFADICRSLRSDYPKSERAYELLIENINQFTQISEEFGLTKREERRLAQQLIEFPGRRLEPAEWVLRKKGWYHSHPETVSLEMEAELKEAEARILRKGGKETREDWEYMKYLLRAGLIDKEALKGVLHQYEEVFGEERGCKELMETIRRNHRRVRLQNLSDALAAGRFLHEAELSFAPLREKLPFPAMPEGTGGEERVSAEEGAEMREAPFGRGERRVLSETVSFEIGEELGLSEDLKAERDLLCPVSDGKKIYFSDGRKIYMSGLDGKNRETVFEEAEKDDYFRGVHSLRMEEGKCTALCHYGSNAMTTFRLRLKIDEEGEIQRKKLDSSGMIHHEIAGADYYIGAGLPPGAGTVEFRSEEEGGYFANEAYSYGAWKDSAGRWRWAGSLGEYGNKIYLMVQKLRGKEPVFPDCRMNPACLDKRIGKTELLLMEPVQGFVLAAPWIYFWTEEGIGLYNIDYRGSEGGFEPAPGRYRLLCRAKGVEAVFPTKSPRPYFLSEGVLMQVSERGEPIAVNGDAKVISCGYEGTTRLYFVCTFEAGKGDSRILITDGFGGRLTSQDPAVSVGIIGDKAYYYNLRTKKITKLDLSSLK